MADEQIILKVSLDEGKTTDRLKQLAVDLAKTRQEQKELKQAYDQGLLSEEAYGAKSVELGRQLRTLSQENTALTKNLDLYNRAVKGVSGSYDQQQAQLSLAQKQYQQLAGSAENTTEETQALSKVIDELRGSLKTTDAGMGLFVRNVGNYGGAIEPLIQQMVKLQEEAKGLADGSREAAEKQRQAAGFLTAAQRAAAQSGQTYDEATKSIENFASSIQPTVSELVKLEQEQARLVDTGEATEDTVRRIGFQIGKLEKDLQQAAKETPALGKSLAGVGKEAQKAEASLDDVASVAGPLAPAIEKLSAAKEKYAQVINLAKVATGGQVGALGALRVALIATGIGAFVVILGSLIAFLTKTQAGSDFLSRKLGALGAIVTKLTSYVVDFGGKLFEAFDNPKQALSDLVDFIGQNLINRLTSVAVLIDGIRNGDFSKITDSAIQFTTGIADGTAKLRGLTEELGKAADEGERLAQMEQELERATNDNISTNKRLLNEVERLKNVRDNEFNTLAVRRKANEDAFKVELDRENRLAGLAQKRVDILRSRLTLEGGRTRNEGLFKELQEAENELVDIREDAAGKQNELITNRYQLYKEGLDKEKEAAEKAAEANRQQLQVEIGLLDVRLQQVRKNSDEELSLLRQKLDTQHRLELAAKDLTVGQKKLADAKYQAESLKLEVDFQRQRSQAALQAQADTLQGELALLQQGAAQANQAAAQGDAQAFEQAKQHSQRIYELQRKSIGLELEQQLAALDIRQDNTEKEFALRAAAEAKLAQLRRDNAAQEVERQRRQLDEQAQLQDIAANELLAGLSEQEQRRVALGAQYLSQRRAAILAERDALILGTREGSAERLRIEQETAQKLFELDQQTADGRKQLYGEMFDSLATLASNAATSLGTIQEAGKDQALARDAFQKRQQLQAAGDNAEQREAIERQHAINQDRIEKEAAEKRRKLQIAQALINGAMGVSPILAAPAAPFVEPFATITRGVQIALVAATTLAQVNAISSQRFQRGGIASGPSHAQGGIPLYHRGRPAGIEIEGGEPVLTAAVSRNRALLTAASAINVAAGGRPLVPRSYLDVGGLTSSAFVRDSLRADSRYNPVELAEAVANSLRDNPPVNRWVDYAAAAERNAFTNQMTDS